MSEMRLYSESGERLYLTTEERNRFEVTTRKQPREIMAFAPVILYTGCRTIGGVGFESKACRFRRHDYWHPIPKKRRTGVFRSIPIPERLVEALDLVHALRESKNKNGKLWGFSRMTGWRKIKEIMEAAGIKGHLSCSFVNSRKKPKKY